MIVSTRGRYALRVMIDLAEQHEDSFTPLKDVSARQNISQKYIEAIMTMLSKTGFVDGAHGKGGGFDKEGTDCNSETAFSPHLHISVIPCKENVDLSDVQINKSKKVACTKNKEEWINLKSEYKIYIDPFNYNKEGGGYAEK